MDRVQGLLVDRVSSVAGKVPCRDRVRQTPAFISPAVRVV
jgi:hypothetical protein